MHCGPLCVRSAQKSSHAQWQEQLARERGAAVRWGEEGGRRRASCARQDERSGGDFCSRCSASRRACREAQGLRRTPLRHGAARCAAGARSGAIEHQQQEHSNPEGANAVLLLQKYILPILRAGPNNQVPGGGARRCSCSFARSSGLQLLLRWPASPAQAPLRRRNASVPVLCAVAAPALHAGAGQAAQPHAHPDGHHQALHRQRAALPAAQSQDRQPASR